MSAKWQRVRIDIPPGFSPSERDAIGQDIVEFIRTRSEKGVGVRKRGNGYENYNFPSYSKEYVKSLDFEIAGKSKGKVDLTLSGDMLIALDVLNHDPSSILIGYENGSEENARADGNIRGTYGRSSPIPGKARNFLGITKADLETILDKYR